MPDSLGEIVSCWRMFSLALVTVDTMLRLISILLFFPRDVYVFITYRLLCFLDLDPVMPVMLIKMSNCSFTQKCPIILLYAV